MSFIDVPPQVVVECDECGAQLECDGIELHFDRDHAAEELRDYDWVIDGEKVLCEECAAGPSGGDQP